MYWSIFELEYKLLTKKEYHYGFAELRNSEWIFPVVDEAYILSVSAWCLLEDPEKYFVEPPKIITLGK